MLNKKLSSLFVLSGNLRNSIHFHSGKHLITKQIEKTIHLNPNNIMKISTTFLLFIFSFFIPPPLLYAQCSIDVGAAGSTEICEGDSLLLEATNGFTGYEWNTEDTTRLLWVQDPGWYIIEAEDDTGCVATDSILILVNDPTPLEIGVDPSEGGCLGDTFLIEASNNFVQYAWSTGDTTRIISLVAIDDVVLVLEAIDSSGCEVREEIEISVEACSSGNDTCEVEIETDFEEPIICAGDSIVLEPISGFTSYSWNTGDSTRIIWAADSGWYIVTAVDDTGCVARDSILLDIVEATPLTISSDPNPAEVCIGGEVVLEIPEGFNDIAWSTGDDDRVIDFRAEESRLIVVEALDENGCEARAEIEIAVDTSCTATSLDKEFQENPPFLIGPNPSKRFIQIQYTGDQSAELRLSILSLNGQLIQEMDTQQIYPGRSIQWHISTQIPGGIYLVDLKLGMEAYRMKLLIQE